MPSESSTVKLVLRVRVFVCQNQSCPVRRFAEQVEGPTVPHARRSGGLRDVLQQLGLALAGRAGVRLATRFGLPISRNTVLRLVRRLPDRPPTVVRVLGMDLSRFRGHPDGLLGGALGRWWRAGSVVSAAAKQAKAGWRWLSVGIRGFADGSGLLPRGNHVRLALRDERRPAHRATAATDRRPARPPEHPLNVRPSGFGRPGARRCRSSTMRKGVPSAAAAVTS